MLRGTDRTRPDGIGNTRVVSSLLLAGEPLGALSGRVEAFPPPGRSSHPEHPLSAIAKTKATNDFIKPPCHTTNPRTNRFQGSFAAHGPVLARTNLSASGSVGRTGIGQGHAGAAHVVRDLYEGRVEIGAAASSVDLRLTCRVRVAALFCGGS